MNDFIEKAHKQIMDAMPELETNTGVLTVDLIVDKIVEGMLYRFKPKQNTKSKHIVILTISSDAQMSDSIAGIIYPLFDNIGFKDDRLIIVHSNGKSKHENDIYTFLSEKVDVFNSDYLRLSCIKDNLKTSIDGEKYINLSNMLRNCLSLFNFLFYVA